MVTRTLCGGWKSTSGSKTLLDRQKFALWFLVSIVGGLGYGVRILIESPDSNSQFFGIVFVIFWIINTILALMFSMVESIMDD